MKAEIEAFITQALTPTISFLFLRGNDTQTRSEGDLDILVSNTQIVLACQLLAERAHKNGWYVLFFRNIGYCAQVVLSRPAPDGEVHSVKVDFIAGLEWYNAGSGDLTTSLFKDFLSEADTEKVRNSIAAAVTFFQKCMALGRLSDRDMARVTQGGATPKLLLDIAHALDLPITESAAITGQLTSFAKWKLRAASAGCHNVLSIGKWLFIVVFAHIKFKLGVGFRSGLVLTLSGLDGSGKSTQLDMLLKAYKKAGMKEPRTIHLLPHWIPLPHHLIRRQATIKNYTRPYSEPPVSSSINATLRLIYYLIAFVIAKVAQRLTVSRGNVIIMDRCFADFAADLSRSKIPHRKIHPSILKFCAPVGCLMFIDAQPEVVVRRKGELTLEKASELRDRYREIFALLEGQIINGDASQQSVFESILGCIDSVNYSRLCQSITQ